MSSEASLAYNGPLSHYAEWHQLSVGVALGLAGRRADRLVVALLWIVLGRDAGVSERLVAEVRGQPHYLAAGFAAGRLLRWRR